MLSRVPTATCRSAAGAVSRLLEMGVEDYLLASSLLGVLAQRLVRLICPECKAATGLEAGGERQQNGIPGHLLGRTYMGKGCPACAKTGYRGRTGIYELMLVEDAVRQLILQRADAAAEVTGVTVDATGLRGDGRMLGLNSYENRVYQVGREEAAPVVVKFYRPGRWSTHAILEEHAFALELAAAEVPVVAPEVRDGRSLFESRGFRYFAVELNDALLAVLEAPN